MVGVSIVDSFEFCSIYFASVLDHRHIIPPERKLFYWHFKGGFHISEHV